MAWRNKGQTLTWVLISVGLTLAGSLLFWWATGSPIFIGLAFLPFLFSGRRLFGGDAAGEDDATGAPPHCVACGYASLDPEGPFCPRCGQRLQ